MARYTEEEKKKRQKSSKASKPKASKTNNKSLKISSTPFNQQFNLKKKAIQKSHPGKEGRDLIKKLEQDYKSMGYI